MDVITLANQGISIAPQDARAGELVKIMYNGLLAQNGADQVYLHMGFGDQWDKSSDLPMQRTINGWQRVIPLDVTGSMNFCFKDSANNWDNNNGYNWRVEVLASKFTS